LAASPDGQIIDGQIQRFIVMNLLKILLKFSKPILLTFLNVEINNVAIGSKKEKKKIYYGKNNIGEASLIQGEEQRQEGETINIFPGSKLPEANIVKIDTEGYEVEILNSIKFQPDIYLIEYHSADNRRFIDSHLTDYILIELQMRNYNYGITKYAKKSLIS